MSTTNHFENLILKKVFHGEDFSINSLQIGLFNVEPSYSTGGSGLILNGEVPTSIDVDGVTTPTAYARITVDNIADNFDFVTDPDLNDGSMIIKNKNKIDFAVPTANWGTIAYIGIFDHANNLLMSSPIGVSSDVAKNAIVNIPVSGVTFKVK